MPEIKQEYCARCITLVPHFVLEAVVEDDAATCDPLQLVLGYPDPASSRLGQVEAADSACVDATRDYRSGRFTLRIATVRVALY